MNLIQDQKDLQRNRKLRRLAPLNPPLYTNSYPINNQNIAVKEHFICSLSQEKKTDNESQ